MKTTEPFPDSEPETTPTPPTRVRWIGVALAASYGLLILTLWPGSWGWWL